jgi:hypothetical protein
VIAHSLPSKKLSQQAWALAVNILFTISGKSHESGTLSSLVQPATLPSRLMCQPPLAPHVTLDDAGVGAAAAGPPPLQSLIAHSLPAKCLSQHACALAENILFTWSGLSHESGMLSSLLQPVTPGVRSICQPPFAPQLEPDGDDAGVGDAAPVVVRQSLIAHSLPLKNCSQHASPVGANILLFWLG